MKTLLLGLAAAASLAMAAQALAHDHDDNDEVWAAQSYGDFNQQYQHIWQGIQHGVGDGSYNIYQARQYYRDLQGILARADWQERRGYYDPSDIEARLERLHDRMHVAHERGHERLNDDWNNGGDYGYSNRSYGYRPYSRR